MRPDSSQAITCDIHLVSQFLQQRHSDLYIERGITRNQNTNTLINRGNVNCLLFLPDVTLSAVAEFPDPFP